MTDLSPKGCPVCGEVPPTPHLIGCLLRTAAAPPIPHTWLHAVHEVIETALGLPKGDPDGPLVPLPVSAPAERVPPPFPLTAYLAMVRGE